MRICLIAIILATALAAIAPCSAASARLVKVLPQFLDQEGRIALSPSLYERDAYQAELRSDPKRRSGIQFAVQWGSRDARQVKLKVEMRGNRGKNGTSATIESPVRYRGLFTSWAKVSLVGEKYQEFGELSAWRATLWDGDKLLADQKSFLW